MGNFQCCEVRVQETPQHGLIKREEVKLQSEYELTPKAEAKYNMLLRKNNNDLFLSVPPTEANRPEIKSKQGFSFLPSVNAYYNGEWNQQNKPEGRGRLIFKNGSILIGKFKDFKCSYQTCHFIFKDGGYYCGGIVNSKLQGRGKLFTSSLQYEGQWDNNLPDGKGDELLGNGDRFVGTFRRGKKNGQHCSYKWYNHKTFIQYEGSFQEGLIKGKGTLYLKNGCKLQGYFTGESIENITLKSSICKYTGNIFKGTLSGKGTMEIITRKQSFQGIFKEGQLYGQCVHIDSKNRRNDCFIFKGKKLAKVVGLDDQEISDLLKSIEEVYSRISSHQQAITQLNLKFNGQYLCELTEPFAIESSHKKYMVIHFNLFTIRILGP